jgi:hypothetical protein
MSGQATVCRPLCAGQRVAAGGGHGEAGAGAGAMAVGAGCAAGFGALRAGGGLRRDGGGGATGCNWTKTGFGTRRGAAGSAKPEVCGSGAATARTGTVCGWNPGRVKVTVNSLTVTATEQGVRQVCPAEVLASAPAGSDSNCMVVAAGAGFGASNCIQLGRLEQEARLKPQAAMATTRFMFSTVRSCGFAAAFVALRAAGELCNRQCPLATPPATATAGASAGDRIPHTMCAGYGK